MASKKKESEGIALLSMYDDDEEDEEMEDAEQHHQQQEDQEQEDEDDEKQGNVENHHHQNLQLEERSEEEEGEVLRGISDGEEDEIRVTSSERMVTMESKDRSTPRVENLTTTPNIGGEEGVSVEVRRRSSSRREKVTIVDYAHDEVALSPETEEGEIEASGQVVYGTSSETANGDFQEKGLTETMQVVSPSDRAISQLSDPLKSSEADMTGRVVTSSEAGEVKEPGNGPADIDPLDKFLPPPPKAKCSEELQEKIRFFIALKQRGKSYNAEVRNKKDYRNPDFLLHAVRYQDIDQIGSCFSKDVFDPHGYDPSDYYDEIELDMKREVERKEQERKRSQQIDFVSGGTQAGVTAPIPKVNMPIAGVATATAINLRSVDAVPRDGRQNKKSKWDKVDGGQESISAVAAHAAILSAANAGAGYTAFAQQRRREAEEKRSSEKKLERRS